MVASKAWTWEISKDDIWKNPSEDVFYYVARWKALGFERFLDLGCGLGRNTYLFAESGFATSAMDLSEYSVKTVLEESARRGLSVDVRHGDMNSLPFDDRSFDCILAYLVISHTDSEGIKLILKEMGRVLRPGGEMYFTLCSKESPAFAEGDFRKVDENTIIKTRGPEIDIPHFYCDESGARELLSDFDILKFRHIKDIYDDSYGWHFHLLCGKPSGSGARLESHPREVIS
jgi:SAM-dependent methyltransferase